MRRCLSSPTRRRRAGPAAEHNLKLFVRRGRVREIHENVCGRMDVAEEQNH